MGSLFARAEAGDAASKAALFASLYAELGRLARRELARGGSHLTLGAATLVHEAFLDIATRDGPVFPDKARFMAYAARAMRGIVIDYSRRRCAIKRGGQFEITALRTEVGADVANEEELAKIGDALDSLATVDPSLAHVVDLKFFCGLSFEEIAQLQGVSTRTVARQWDKARIFLHATLQDGGAD